MPAPHELLHEKRFRPHWRALLLGSALLAGWFAFQPGPGAAPVFTGWDKLQHLAAFGTMGCAGALGVAPGRAAAWRVAAGLLGYGIFIEIVQLWIPGRDCSFDDVVADALGIAAGLLMAAALRRLWPRR